MTKQEARSLKVGDKVATRYGEVYTVRDVFPYWRGFLTSKMLEEVKDKPDGYYIKVGDDIRDSIEHKRLKVVKVFQNK